jgi:two-component system, response regulator YesN
LHCIVEGAVSVFRLRKPEGVLLLYKLLIADDEFEIRNGLSSYFPWEQIGFEIVHLAENGLEVLQYIAEHEVDVILCDIRMPVLTGIDVARELFNQKSTIFIIFLSGYREFEYAQQALVYGVKNYIVKPTKYNELVSVFQAVKEELDQKSTQLPKLDLEVMLPTKPIAVTEKIIDTIKNHIELHYQNATLESASRLVHMNPYYVSKYFKQKTGENFSDYLIRIKMEKAAELLMDFNNKTYEISEMVGYSNAKNFTRTFRKYFGKSPREYRNTD